ncbi:MAG: sucrose-phosphate phosphatase [Cyanophyceae cyanobacterium]
MSSFLFATDLDHTLVGDEAALAELNQQLHRHRQENQTRIVYVTGRSLFRYRQLTQEQSLLPPDALITSVGTELYFDPTQDAFDANWAQILSSEWDREQVVAIAGHFSDLTPQADSEQNPFKVSYFLSETVADELIPRLESALTEQNLSFKVIYSGGEDLDILPAKGDKGLAIQFLRQKWKISAEQTVVCGDSGNDIALFGGDERGVIVGNARPELLQWYRENCADHRYLAQASAAGGILEGLKHFGFLE